MTDSVGIYYIGSGSSNENLQLVSYPSRRDAFEYGKTRRIKVKGCADINHVVMCRFLSPQWQRLARESRRRNHTAITIPRFQKQARLFPNKSSNILSRTEV